MEILFQLTIFMSEQSLWLVTYTWRLQSANDLDMKLQLTPLVYFISVWRAKSILKL